MLRCYTQHDLRSSIDSETNHKMHFIKVPYIKKGIEFINLHSILRIDQSLHPYFLISKILNRQLSVINIYQAIRNTIFNFNKFVPDLDIHANTP